uniref:[acyl-carrier-protein] S-malonyltransferase n=1 Tax=Streptomyces sp. NBC_00003 TaxID=2903608 RepID=A0AAU2VBJ6_9ACTN
MTPTSTATTSLLTAVGVPETRTYTFAATTVDGLIAHLDGYRKAPAASWPATTTYSTPPDTHQVRAACCVNSPQQLEQAVTRLLAWLADGVATRHDPRNGCFLRTAPSASPRIGLLFPGQGVPMNLGGGAWSSAFPHLAVDFPSFKTPDRPDTSVAQPAITGASTAALTVLSALEITANVAIGHSLGELTALYWAGSIGQATLSHLATVRGRAMQQLGDPLGTMANLSCSPRKARALIRGLDATVACENSPLHTVIAGRRGEVARAVQRAEQAGVAGTVLDVARAFHTPLVAEAADAFAAQLQMVPLLPPRGRVVSTVTGDELAKDTDLADLLTRQITAPVLFSTAVRRADMDVDLWIEAGPGRVLTKLLPRITDTPVVAMDAGAQSLDGLQHTLAALHCAGASTNSPYPPLVTG